MRAFDVVVYGLTLVLIFACARTAHLFQLESQFAFYASYHANRLNQAIHIACIWPLLWTALVIADFTTPIAPTPPPLGSLLTLNAGALIAAIYALYYLALDRKSAYGLLSALGVVACYGLARRYRTCTPDAVTTAACVHLACWISQFAGHALFERRAPALFENLAQALLMAPHFVLIEVYLTLGARRDLEALVNKRQEVFTAARARMP
ncbi:hypothetical protein T492DRAFT_586084 [Pavlovales sp. CCMP2436]|nr:hypothetical protein T492DRAFT_586084 [Pavlovales sp. CCMP2436]